MTMIQTQTTTQLQYGIFQKRRENLLALIQRQLKVLHSLDMKSQEETLYKLSNRVQADSFKVLVLGEFKRGKSTFINALLGDEVLPAYAKPCTAIINEVKWGESKRALLHYSQAEDGYVKPPQEIPVERIEECVVIKDHVGEIKANPYDKVELFWNLPLCQNGVEIIDSPGLNEHDIRQKVTTDYLSKVDAILFVLSCEVLCSQSELDFIDTKLKRSNVWFSRNAKKLNSANGYNGWNCSSCWVKSIYSDSSYDYWWHCPRSFKNEVNKRQN